MTARTGGRHDPAEDRAAALFRELRTLESDEPRIADPTERAIARLLDLGFWIAFTFAWGIAVSYFDQLWFPDERQTFVPNRARAVEQIEPVIAWAGFIGLILSIYMFEVLPTAWRGRHWPKKRLSLRVVGPNGGPPGLWRASVRWVAWWVPLVAASLMFTYTFTTDWAALFILSQGLALMIPGWIFRDDAHRGLHDRLAGTRVLADR